MEYEYYQSATLPVLSVQDVFNEICVDVMAHMGADAVMRLQAVECFVVESAPTIKVRVGWQNTLYGAWILSPNGGDQPHFSAVVSVVNSLGPVIGPGVFHDTTFHLWLYGDAVAPVDVVYIWRLTMVPVQLTLP